MIKIDHISFSYGEENENTGGVRDIDLNIEDGQFVVLCGESGCGKTTITRLINGLIPHYYEGQMAGEVWVNGEKVSEQPLYDTAAVVGSVFQNPRSQFFNVDTTSEITFGCENLGQPEKDIRERFAKTVRDFRLEKLMDRNIFHLSGGEKQKIACAGVSIMEPDVLVMDEPSSNLDAASILDLRKIFAFWKSQGKTIIDDRVEGMEPTFAHLIPEMTANVLVPLVIVVYLFVMDWRMALLSLVTLVVGLAVMSAGMKNYPVKWEGAVKAGKQMANAIVEYIGGIEVVKAFSQSAGSYKKYSDAVNYNANYYVDWMRENQKTMSAYNAILPSVLICVLPCGFAFWLSCSLELSTFLSIVIFSLGLIGPIIAAFTFTDDLAVLGTNVEEISQLLNAEELNHKETPIKLEDTGISLRSVSFSYDGTTEVLHDVNLAIHPGTMTALVGPSGSGKSTVAKLIAGYWDVTSGSITLGGHELKDMPLSEIADQISYVSQDNYLFNRSIRENIRMGRPSATDAEVEQAAKQSGCDAFIRKLDNGYDTVVGSAGSHLSGGERQRIAIARAMLKNAPVVILDEATAYIDPENEALVQKAISTLTVGKTLIVIAHRLSTIVGADNIVVVKDGTIHAQGTHEKLLETCPLYRDMWQAHIGAKDQM